MATQTAVIIGAGPAGLTAAHELLSRTAIRPIVLEQSAWFGGISRTECYRGNRMDIGGHRFFSKSDRIMRWWLDKLPLQTEGIPDGLTLPPALAQLSPPAVGPRDPATCDELMLIRRRRSRIYYGRAFYDYPITLSRQTLANLGLARTARIGLTYAAARAHPIHPERNLEDFFVNRFGRELYRTFFESYTEKVWGRPCTQISAEWGAQRVKGLSVTQALRHAAGRLLARRRDADQTETSLIEQFYYPKLGPGQLWEQVAAGVQAGGGEVRRNVAVTGVRFDGRRVTGVETRDTRSGAAGWVPADRVFSSMPVRDLVAAMGPAVPSAVRDVAGALAYRDFITVGLLYRRLGKRTPRGAPPLKLDDNWIYVQEPDVRLGRIQIFNNWSHWLVADPQTVWLGLEYFCQEGDQLWSLPDAELVGLARTELEQIGLAAPEDALDGTVIRVPKAYPGYFDAYANFGVVRDWLQGIANLHPIGRNGMHRYNNQDHSMLTAMATVDHLVAGTDPHRAVWQINAEQAYHEEK